MQIPTSWYYSLYTVQVDLMMSDKHPVDAMCYIRDLGLFYVVFAFPEKLDPPVLDKHDWYVFVLIFSYLCVDYMQVPNYSSHGYTFRFLDL
jgi:hypothetical protein